MKNGSVIMILSMFIRKAPVASIRIVLRRPERRRKEREDYNDYNNNNDNTTSLTLKCEN